MPQDDSFRALGASDAVASALEQRGIHSPFPIQLAVVPDAIRGEDILAKSPTGSGKTLAFAVPIVEDIDPEEARPTALVLVPTRELAAQVAEEFEAVASARGLRVGLAYGGVAIAPQANRAKDAHVLVATPGRLTDLVERRLVSLNHIRILVLDEADRMLDMGFKPQVDRIVRKLSGPRQTMFFSATLDGEVGQMATRYTRNPCSSRGRADRAARRLRGRASVRSSHAPEQGRDPGRSACRGSWPCPRLLQDEAWRGQARTAAAPPGRRGRVFTRRYEPEGA